MRLQVRAGPFLLWSWIVVFTACAQTPPASPPAAPPAPQVDDLERALPELRAADERDEDDLVIRQSTGLLNTATARRRPIDTSTIELFAMRGWALWNRGHKAEAVRTWQEAEAQWRAAGLAPSMPIASVWSGLGFSLKMQGDYEAGLTYNRKALDVREHAQPPDPLRTAVSAREVASTLVFLGRPKEAYPLLERAIGLLVARDKRTELNLVTALATMAEAHRYALDIAGAEPPFERAVAISARYEAERGSARLDLMLRLAQVKSSLGKTGEKRALLEQALVLVRRTPKLVGSEPTVLGPLADAIASLEGEPAAEQFRQAHGFVHTVRVTDRSPAGKELPGADHGRQVEDAERVVERAKQELHACFRATLARYPKASGTSRVTMKINAEGEVWRAEATSIGLPAQTNECILDVVTRAKFQRPEGGGATVIMPVTFQVRDD